MMSGETLTSVLIVAAVVFSGMFLYKITRKQTKETRLRELSHDYK
jgi:preprotein translocase subunit YajC